MTDTFGEESLRDAPGDDDDDASEEPEQADRDDVVGVARELFQHPEVREAALEFARDVRAKAESSSIGRALLQIGRDWFAGRQAREAREKEHDEG